VRNLTKTNTLLGGALGLQLLLTGAFAFARTDHAIQPPAALLAGLVADKVTKVSIEAEASGGAAKNKVELTKAGDQWTVASADGYPADAAKVKTLLESLEKLKAGAPIASKDGFYKKLEVADDTFQRKVSVEADGKTYAFLLGSSPGLKRVHFRRVGEKDVFRADGVSAWDVGGRTTDWVDRAYFKVAEADVWGVELTNAKGTIKLERSPMGEWALAGAPADKTLKKSAVDELVRKVAAVNLDEVAGKGEKPEQGLGAPLATVKLVTGTSTIAGAPPKTTQVETWLVGAKHPTEAQFFVRSAKSPYVVRAASWSVEALTTRAADELFETPAKTP
jgi:hypothetical protein